MATDRHGEPASLETFCDVSIEPDRMTATLRLSDRPQTVVVRGVAPARPVAGRATCELPALPEILRFVLDQASSRGVSVDLNQAEIKAALALWARLGARRQLTIARGRPPKRGEDGVIVLKPPAAPVPPGRLSADRVRRRDQGFVVNVEEGTLLATVTPPSQGEAGHTVTGAVVPAEPGKPHQLEIVGAVAARQAGGHTTYHATTSAILVELTRGRIHVAPHIELRRNVDHDTGNVDAWGSVTIHGAVENGFSVRARGDIIVDGLCDSSYLESSGSVLVRGGILGRTGATEVKCRGDCTARFIENAEVRAGGKVVAGEFVVNSRIQASEEIEVRGRGTVLASSLAAEGSIVASTMGSDAALPVQLAVGYSPALRQRLERIQREVRALRRTCMKGALASARHRSPAARRESDRLASRRRTAALLERTAMRKERSLVHAIHGDRSPRIVVRQAAYPRTTVRVGPFSMNVEHLLSAGAFVLDLEHGRIEWVPA